MQWQCISINEHWSIKFNPHSAVTKFMNEFLPEHAASRTAQLGSLKQFINVVSTRGTKDPILWKQHWIIYQRLTYTYTVDCTAAYVSEGSYISELLKKWLKMQSWGGMREVTYLRFNFTQQFRHAMACSLHQRKSNATRITSSLQQLQKD